MNTKAPTSSRKRWPLKLSEYNNTVIYKKGNINTNADDLSRVVLHNEEISPIVVNPPERPLALLNFDTKYIPNPILEIAITDAPTINSIEIFICL